MPEEKAVPVEVKVLVWVKRSEWEAEHSVDTVAPGYDFEEAFQQYFIEECQEVFVSQDEMHPVTEVTA